MKFKFWEKPDRKTYEAAEENLERAEQRLENLNNAPTPITMSGGHRTQEAVAMGKELKNEIADAHNKIAESEQKLDDLKSEAQEEAIEMNENHDDQEPN